MAQAYAANRSYLVQEEIRTPTHSKTQVFSCQILVGYVGAVWLPAMQTTSGGFASGELSYQRPLASKILGNSKECEMKGETSSTDRYVVDS